MFIFKGYTDKSGYCESKNPFSAQITSGLDANNPEFGYREIVPTLKKTFVYGVVAESYGYGTLSNWNANQLIGLRQIRDKLIVGLFSKGTGVNGQPADFKEPVRTIILTKVPL